MANDENQAKPATNIESNPQDEQQQAEAITSAQAAAFQHTLFCVKNDRMLLNAIASTEPLPLKRSVIGYIFGFFAIYLLIIGICGAGFYSQFDIIYKQHEEEITNLCGSGHKWLQTYYDLADQINCAELQGVKCFTYNNDTPDDWTEFTQCVNGKRHKVRQIREQFYVIQIPSEVKSLQNLYVTEDCQS